ncbi:hypothetical protein MGYG_02048 [Nannizzia gypsea CBS 118893]|uniref:Uncharacterized protein n=1 Tax=Arthroderma gypseum (strain ATCC MYA-4604 / CBS 118893) TaxID=535722 RepID=E4UPE7_ARTGP|nr:hypothetical protein MGYG_02048 [Nannizzia gypsea CBS 118893]EFQ99036.1 hypothetical protein MGYG_02048 [Nannizzia gypsea CBS 118893]
MPFAWDILVFNIFNYISQSSILTIPSICVKTNDQIRCTSSAFSSPDTIRKRLMIEIRGALPELPINQAIKLQAAAFINAVSVAVVLFCFSLIFGLLQYHSTRKQPIKRASRCRWNFFRQASLACACSACAFKLAATLAITGVSGIFAIGFRSVYTIKTGTVSLALHWTVTILCFLVCIGLIMLRRTTSDVIGGSKPVMFEQGIKKQDFPLDPDGFGTMN